MTSLLAACRKHFPAAHGLHSCAEPVRLRAPPLPRLISTLWQSNPPLYYASRPAPVSRTPSLSLQAVPLALFRIYKCTCVPLTRSRKWHAWHALSRAPFLRRFLARGGAALSRTPARGSCAPSRQPYPCGRPLFTLCPHSARTKNETPEKVPGSHLVAQRSIRKRSAYDSVSVSASLMSSSACFCAVLPSDFASACGASV